MKLSHALQGFWLEKRQRFSTNTVRNYSYVFRYFQEFLGDVEFESIKSVDIRRFLEHLAVDRNYSKRSVHDALIPLSSLWTWAEKELETKHIIRKRIEEPTYPPVLIDPFTQDEVKALLIAAEETKPRRKDAVYGAGITVNRPTALRDRSIILLLFDTGFVHPSCAL